MKRIFIFSLLILKCVAMEKPTEYLIAAPRANGVRPDPAFYISRLFIKIFNRPKRVSFRFNAETYQLLSSFTTLTNRSIKVACLYDSEFFSVDIDGDPKDGDELVAFINQMKESFKVVGFSEVYDAAEFAACLRKPKDS